MVHADLLATVFAIMPFLIAIIDWFGVTLPRQPTPISPTLAVFFSISSFSACIVNLRHSSDRFALHWIGTWESALRTVAALDIISQTELNYALNYIQTNGTEGVQK
jgi:hypothetical protein